jgi:5-oxoprolinase (ATP-hydrolysing)
MEGGGPGGLGRNTWIKQPRQEDGDIPETGGLEPRNINIGSKATIWMGKGDRFLIETPGGGAWGAVPDIGEEGKEIVHVKEWAARGSLAERAAAQNGF